MLNFSLFQYILIVSIVNSVPPISSYLFKTAPYPFLNDYNRKSFKGDLTHLNVDATRTSDRAMRYIGENNVICEVSITKEVFFEEGYDFFPTEYVNKTCINTNNDPFVAHTHEILKPEICLHNDNQFGCQTLYEDLYVLKKSSTNGKECWEHTSQTIAVGCKCNIRFDYN